MPFYTVLHSLPLTDAQRDDLAQRITSIHAQLFTRPAIFINVRFVDYSATPHYIGGKRRTGDVNLILAQTRAGPSRTAILHERLCKQLEEAWEKSISGSASNGTGSGADEKGVENSHSRRRLTTVWILGSIAAAYEHGFMVPVAGQDRNWLREMLPEFRRQAADGQHPDIEDMLAELGSRDDFKDIMSADAA